MSKKHGKPVNSVVAFGIITAAGIAIFTADANSVDHEKVVQARQDFVAAATNTFDRVTESVRLNADNTAIKYFPNIAYKLGLY